MFDCRNVHSKGLFGTKSWELFVTILLYFSWWIYSPKFIAQLYKAYWSFLQTWSGMSISFLIDEENSMKKYFQNLTRTIIWLNIMMSTEKCVTRFRERFEIWLIIEDCKYNYTAEIKFGKSFLVALLWGKQILNNALKILIYAN